MVKLTNFLFFLWARLEGREANGTTLGMGGVKLHRYVVVGGTRQSFDERLQSSLLLCRKFVSKLSDSNWMHAVMYCLVHLQAVIMPQYLQRP